MSITLRRSPLRPSIERSWGATFGLLLGLVAAFSSLTTAEIGFTSRAIALATVPIGATLGWFFAPTAARPGWRHGVVAAVAFAGVAVMIGAFAVAAQASVVPGSDAGTAIGATLGWGLVGLIFLGLPMFALAMPFALVWAGAVRLALRLTRSRAAST